MSLNVQRLVLLRSECQEISVHLPQDLMTKENVVVYRTKECSRSFAFEGATEKCRVLVRICVPFEQK